MDLAREINDFYNGENYYSYNLFGSFYSKDKTTFRLYAPHADKVFIVGDFNNFTEINELKKIDDFIFEITIENVKLLDHYKYIIYKNGRRIEKTDPYSKYYEVKPGSASRVVESTFTFTDDLWISKRDKCTNKPMNIYELHLGSWLHFDNEKVNYKKITKPLIKYIKEMNFTHVEFMPLTEYPYDPSWGYQAYGYFAPTSRYGTNDELKYLINELHKEGIGVILDFVLAHFVKDSYGLSYFSGDSQYEYSDYNKANSEWDTLYFDLGNKTVQSFLLSSLNYFITEYHFDGIRIDAVANILYNHGKVSLGENKTAVDFIKNMNYQIKRIHNDKIIMIAEDSSDFYKVTGLLEEAGLGFDYKWCLGWMHDTLKYLKMDPVYRSHHHNLLTFSMMYNYNEKYILALSHDEVVHGKMSIVSKMWGTEDMQIATAKAMYVYMFTHPGHKLNFMGNEIAHFIEFDESRQLDWFLLDYPRHNTFKEFFKDLSTIYKKEKTLSTNDFDPISFSFINADKKNDNIFIYRRTSKTKDYIVILNFSNNYYENYRVGTFKKFYYEEILNTDDLKYGGYGVYNGLKKVETFPSDYLDTSILINIAPLSAIILRSKSKK